MKEILKKIKIIVPLTKLASTFEPINKTFEAVLIPSNSSPRGQVSHAPGKLLTSKNECSED